MLKTFIIIVLSEIYTSVYVFADDELQKIQNSIIHLQSVVRESDKYLKAKNQEFKYLSKELDTIGEKITLTEITLQHYKNKVNNDYERLKSAWNVIVLQQIEPQRHAEYVISKDQNLQTIKAKSLEIRDGLQRAAILDKDLNVLKEQYLAIKSKADILLGLIQKVESHKISVMNKIYASKGQEKNIENKIIRNDLELKIAKEDFTIQKNFITPLQTYSKIEKSDTGVNFTYKGDALILAPLQGKIAYIGELSTYGQVIMIEHDNKMMSVLLGDITSDLKEDDIVTQGSVIGKAFKDGDGGSKSLYYELRKEERPISTLSYLKI